MINRFKKIFLPTAAVFFPGVCFAQALTSTAGLFYALSGIILTIGILIFIGGLAMWFDRLGTYPTHREETIHVMELGVTILFALIVLLIAVHYIQAYTQYAYLALALIIIYFVAKLFMSEKKKEEEKKKEGGH